MSGYCHKAKKRAAKEKKAKEVEERKAVVAACKLAAQAKKRAKLILLMEAHAQGKGGCDPCQTGRGNGPGGRHLVHQTSWLPRPQEE